MVIGELATCVNSFMCSQPIEGREGCFARREALANKRLLFRVYPAQARIAILMLMLLLKLLVTVMILMVSSWFGPSRQHLGLCPSLRLPCVDLVWNLCGPLSMIVTTLCGHEEHTRRETLFCSFQLHTGTWTFKIVKILQYSKSFQLHYLNSPVWTFWWERKLPAVLYLREHPVHTQV